MMKNTIDLIIQFP